ncbi:MAG TPA: 4-carboxy-4-hydroxy-2-oxoadipate aldolase/oxaloacetate decarboxylase [Eudoraea sp.]|nr:4-carboxy-4-hydroxy-2-oxoadipate aldolase/oxaloacetate decarboxylase [Eudoraea sp.]
MATKVQLDALSKFGTATIHEALGKMGNLPYQIKPLNKKMRVCGPAYPVQCKQYSNINLHRAYAHARPGDVIIADCSGAYDAGYWGDLLTTGAMKHGISGLVIDGCVRDGDEIEVLGFPVFCRGLAIRGTGKEPDGCLNKPITIGDIQVLPGDIVVGDRDGVVIVPKNSLEEAIEKSRAREARETSVRERLNAGESSLKIYGWDKKFGD